MPLPASTHAKGGENPVWVYSFGPGCPTPPLDRNLLGGKGKGEAEMTAMGLPVPPGFIVTTEACVHYKYNRLSFPKGLVEQVEACLVTLEKQMGCNFGDVENPLLISVRSGARVSMPGMMETVLDVGLNDKSVLGLAKKLSNERAAYDSYRRFIAMYSNVVSGVNSAAYEDALKACRKREGVQFDIGLSTNALKELCQEFKHIHNQQTGQEFPQEPRDQLFRAIKGVFHSWDCDKARAYRRFHGFPDDWGTAVVVMAMVFGNRGDDSGTGVGFTRDPATGEHHFYGEYLVNAQGEDVVAGIRTPHPINKMQALITGSNLPSLEETMPEIYQQLEEVGRILEQHYHDMQDVEFTIDNGKLYMLQTRTGKRTGFAAVKIAFDMLREGLIDEREAVKHVDAHQVTQLLTPIFDMRDKVMASGKLATRGLNAGPGAASGAAVFSSEKAVEYQKQGKPCVLMREETSPEDFAGMVAARGILTARGGATSHAAVVARGLGRPCVCGCGDLVFDHAKHEVRIGSNGMVLKEGEPVSIDGTTGQVFFCSLQTKPSEIIQVLIDKTKRPEESELFQQFKTIMDIADKYRRLEVRANADTPQDAAIARSLGAQGIGLVRTEHMFMDKKRLMDVRAMFFSDSEDDRKAAANRLMPYQKEDFLGIFRAMHGLTVTIRLLDPPRHEFLPHTEDEQKALAAHMGTTLERVKQIGESITEANPMLGHRGCRLGIALPYVTEMQTRAIIEAAVEVSKEGSEVLPEIMVPLVATKKELEHQKGLIDKTAQDVFKKMGKEVPYKVGTMIELPRAALQAGQIAEFADFFSFGTNDLTQCTYGISRDDAGQFLPLYVEGVFFESTHSNMQVFDFEPFQTLDQDGVGELMKIARERGRRTNPHLHLGICGEHGGEGRSVKFCHEIGLDYCSCSPFRVPVARLAAAQAAVEGQSKK